MSEAYTFSRREPHPELRNGDQMKQPEFHLLYEQMPETFKAELVDGTVFVAMPLGRPHAKGHIRLSSVLDAYAARTSGVEALSEATVILGQDDEVQPDVLLRVTPAYGGQTSDTYKHFVTGAPELVCEVAYSSRSIDLHLKRKRYAKAGVQEYIVLCLNPWEVRWFDFANKTMIEAEDGVFRSKVFPGLWIGAGGPQQFEYDKVMSVLESGLKSAEHTEFVSRLEARKTMD